MRRVLKHPYLNITAPVLKMKVRASEERLYIYVSANECFKDYFKR